MNPTKLLAACALFALAGTSDNLRAAIDITDSATYYNTENWYVFRSNATPTLTSDETSITFGGLDTSNSYGLAYLSRVSLDTGDAYTISGTLCLSSYSSTGTLVIGLFDSVDNPESEIPDNQNKLGITDYTKSMSGIMTSLTEGVYRPLSSTEGFLSTGKTGNKIHKEYASAFSPPESGIEFCFVLNLLKTDDGFDCTVSLGGEEEKSFSVETDTLSCIDVLGFRFSSDTKGTATLTELSVSTTGTIIPEPSTFCLMGGGLSLALLALRRRRSARRSRV